jgi:hypothetical protein
MAAKAFTTITTSPQDPLSSDVQSQQLGFVYSAATNPLARYDPVPTSWWLPSVDRRGIRTPRRTMIDRTSTPAFCAGPNRFPIERLTCMNLRRLDI